MHTGIVGLTAVIYRIRKLRTEERLAALARGLNVLMQAELAEAAQSRRYGTLLTAGAIGYVATFALIIPLALGLG